MSWTRGVSSVSSRPTVVSTTTSSRGMPARSSGSTPAACARLTALAGVTALLGACSGLYVSPLAPAPYQVEVAPRYDATWGAVVRALARENVPIRPSAREPGVIASDDFIAP